VTTDASRGVTEGNPRYGQEGISRAGNRRHRLRAIVSPVPGSLENVSMLYRGFASPHPRLAAVIALRLITALRFS